MVSCTKYVKDQDYAEFYSDTLGEINKLPTLTQSGKDELAYMNSVSAGSCCILKNADVYILTGNNAWSKLA